MTRWPAVVLTVALMTAACTGQDAPSAGPVTAPSGSSGPSAPSRASEASPPRLDCRRPSRRKVEGDPVVPSGAVAARLCGGLVDNAGFDMTWPADTLRGSRVRRLVDRLNDLEPYEQPWACELVLTPGFDLVLAYPDGSRVWIDGDTSGNCAHIAVRGGRRWTGADQVLRHVLALVEAQRGVVGAAAGDGGARCPRSWNDVAYTAGAAPVEPRDQVTVTLCRYRLDRPEPGTITQSADGRLANLMLVGNPRPLLREAVTGPRADPCHGVAYDLARTQDVLLVQDGYGDVHPVSTAPCWANRLGGRRRYPGARLAGHVAALLRAGLGPVQAGGGSPGGPGAAGLASPTWSHPGSTTSNSSPSFRRRTPVPSAGWTVTRPS